MGDHAHMCLSIPPMYAVWNVVGYLKGKSAIPIALRFGGMQKNFTGKHLGGYGYFVSTVCLDEAMVPAYIRVQEEEDERYDHMRPAMGLPPTAAKNFMGVFEALPKSGHRFCRWYLAPRARMHSGQ
jgi:hypothetical protein